MDLEVPLCGCGYSNYWTGFMPHVDVLSLGREKCNDLNRVFNQQVSLKVYWPYVYALKFIKRLIYLKNHSNHVSYLTRRVD